MPFDPVTVLCLNATGQRRLRDWLLSPSPSSNNLCSYRSTVAFIVSFLLVVKHTYNSHPVCHESGGLRTPRFSSEKPSSTPRLITIMWLVPGVAGLSHYKNRAEKPRTADSSVGSSSSVVTAARLEGHAVCKTERLQALSTPLGPFDKNYSRKRLREHSLDRTDCESCELSPGSRLSSIFFSRNAFIWRSFFFTVIWKVHGVKNGTPSDEFVAAQGNRAVV